MVPLKSFVPTILIFTSIIGMTGICLWNMKLKPWSSLSKKGKSAIMPAQTGMRTVCRQLTNTVKKKGTAGLLRIRVFLISA